VRYPVAGVAGVAQEHAPPTAAEDEGSAEAGRPAADDDHVEHGSRWALW
jgi:hypothetical protein